MDFFYIKIKARMEVQKAGQSANKTLSIATEADIDQINLLHTSPILIYIDKAPHNTDIFGNGNKGMGIRLGHKIFKITVFFPRNNG